MSRLEMRSFGAITIIAVLVLIASVSHAVRLPASSLRVYRQASHRSEVAPTVLLTMEETLSSLRAFSTLSSSVQNLLSEAEGLTTSSKATTNTQLSPVELQRIAGTVQSKALPDDSNDNEAQAAEADSDDVNPQDLKNQDYKVSHLDLGMRQEDIARDQQEQKLSVQKGPDMNPLDPDKKRVECEEADPSKCSNSLKEPISCDCADKKPQKDECGCDGAAAPEKPKMQPARVSQCLDNVASAMASKCCNNKLCPHTDGECCGDGKHCCPKGTTCGNCDKPPCCVKVKYASFRSMSPCGDCDDEESKQAMLKLKMLDIQRKKAHELMKWKMKLKEKEFEYQMEVEKEKLKAKLLQAKTREQEAELEKKKQEEEERLHQPPITYKYIYDNSAASSSSSSLGVNYQSPFGGNAVGATASSSASHPIAVVAMCGNSPCPPGTPLPPLPGDQDEDSGVSGSHIPDTLQTTASSVVPTPPPTPDAAAAAVNQNTSAPANSEIIELVKATHTLVNTLLNQHFSPDGKFEAGAQPAQPTMQPAVSSGAPAPDNTLLDSTTNEESAPVASADELQGDDPNAGVSIK